MDTEVMRKKFLGSIIGDAVGDTTGAALEFWDREQVARHPQGTEWIDELLPSVGRGLHPLGLWRPDPPVGTGTDDTRMNQIFVEAVIKYGGLINSRLLAAEYVDRYVNRDRYYPGYHDLSTGQFTYLFVSACGELDMDCPVHPGMPTHALRSGAGGFNIPGFTLRPGMGALLHPILLSLLMLPTAGLMHPADPEAAYEHAFELAYQDIGYAKDATALLAAMVAAGLDESLTPRAAIRRALDVDPFYFGEGRVMVKRIRQFLDFADQAQSDRELVLMVSRAVQGMNPFDPIDILGIAAAACYRANGDPQRAILMAVNDRDFDEEGEFRNYRDIDCTGSVCGALAGALAPGGIDDFPAGWVASAISANREVYGFDIEANARRMADVITAALA